MAINPYEPRNADGSVDSPPIRRYLVSGFLLAAISLVIALPGLLLINQQWQVVPTNTSFFFASVNGEPISNETVICYSLAGSTTLMTVSCSLFFRARKNRLIGNTLRRGG